MPPRGSEGLDFTPVLTHYLFLFTTILAIIAWFIAFIGQCVATAHFGNGAVNVLWFAIFVQLFLIAGVVYTLASDSIAMNRFQISTFGSIAIVFGVIGVNNTIFTSQGSLDAVAAGWVITTIVDIVWVLYFTAEEDSLMLHIFNSMGSGGLSGPSRRRGGRARSIHMVNNGYAANYGSGGGIGSHDIVPYDTKLGPGIGGGGPIGSTGGAIRSQASFNGGSLGDGNRSMGENRSFNNAPLSGGPGSAGGDHATAPTSPLMGGGNAGIGSGGAMSNPSTTIGGEPQPDTYSYRAKALYAYTASPDDPNEISFTKGEILDIVDKAGKWWQAKKADGTVGIAPSNYLQVI